MNKKLLTLILASASSVAAIVTGCGSEATNTSATKAMSSNDWFKSGVDRFYLAHIDSSSKIDPNYQYTYGDRYFIGIGCYGEPKNPSAIVKVKKSVSSNQMVNIALNKRTMIHQFPITKSDTPRKGECKVLLGSTVNPRQIAQDKSLTLGGDRSDVLDNLTLAGLGCFSLVATSAKFVATAVAGGYATAQTVGIAGAVVIPAIIADGAGVVTSGFYCGLKARGAHREVGEFQKSENTKLFIETLKKASETAQSNLLASGELELFQSLTASTEPEKIILASAIWNKALVSAFNSEVETYFENGWSNQTKFFDAVEQIKTEGANKATPYED